MIGAEFSIANQSASETPEFCGKMFDDDDVGQPLNKGDDNSFDDDDDDFDDDVDCGENQDTTYIGTALCQLTDAEDSDLYESKIGGKPVWPTEKDMKSLPSVPRDQLYCQICKVPLFLVCQVFAPMNDLDRFLYVFACNNASCQNHSGRYNIMLLNLYFLSLSYS